MARSKKIVEKQEELPKEIVWNVLDFARSLTSGLYPGLITPDLLSQRMKDISFQPLPVSEADLNSALANPKNSEESLRGFVENFEILSMPFKRILAYMASHLSLDLLYTVKNAQSTDYKSSKFIKDQNIVYDYLDRFDYQFHFRNAIKQMLRNELYVAIVREDGEKIVLQELPLQYCKITSRWDYGLLASFNFYYFLQPGVDLDLYPSFFKRKFSDIFASSNVQDYNPALPVELRGNSQYVYWVDLPPEMGWVFKLDTSLITSIPFFSALMPDLLNQGIMRTLQKNLNMASAAKILFGEVPMLKDIKSANVKDMIAIDPKTLGQFLNLVKTAIGDAVKIASAPLENMSVMDFKGNDELYDKYLRTALSSSGMDTALIYASQLKANLVDSQLSFQSDSKIMEQLLYPQFGNFMNYWINKKTKYFKYNFWFEGNDYYLSRQQRLERANGLADKGIVLPQLYSSAIGMKPHDFIRMMQESKATKFTDMLTPIMPAGKGLVGTEGGVGRPEKSDSELGDAGAQTKEAGGNIAR